MRVAMVALLSAWVALTGCTPEASLNPSPPASYRAIGQEPGWLLEIAAGRAVYLGDYGTVRLELALSPPRATTAGYRYEARSSQHSLSIDVAHGLCRDAMSGRAFADRVKIVADGRTVEGCGGARQPAQDQ
jgi:uncharacterized membrane protein